MGVYGLPVSKELPIKPVVIETPDEVEIQRERKVIIEKYYSILAKYS